MIPDNFINHIVFEKLEQLKQALLEENTKERIGIDNSVFFESFYLFTADRLRLTIPALVQETELVNLASEIESGTSQLNAFLGNNNVGHISNAINNFNSALNRVRNLPMPLSKSDFDFSRIATNFQKTIEVAYKSIEEINQKLQNELRATQHELDMSNAQIASLHHQIIIKENEIQNALTNYNTEFEMVKANNNASLEIEKMKFNDSLEADRRSFKDQFEADNAANAKAFDEQKGNFETQSKEVINNLNSKLAEANKIVNIVGNVGVTGNYQKIANQHENSANFFRGVALFFMVIMSSLLIWSIIELRNQEFDLYKSLVRILAAAILTYPAIYASRESKKHRELETQNRNLELELASIGPFIELLPEDKKQKIKEELVKKYFGNNNSETRTKEDEEDISINGLEKLLKAILPFIKK